MTGNSDSPARRQPTPVGQVSPGFARLLSKYGASPRLMRKIKGITRNQDRTPTDLSSSDSAEAVQLDEAAAASGSASSLSAADILTRVQERHFLVEALAQVVHSAADDTQGEDVSSSVFHEVKGYAGKVPISIASEALYSVFRAQDEWAKKGALLATRHLAPSVTPDMHKLRRQLAEALRAYGKVSISMDHTGRGFSDQSSKDSAAGPRPNSAPTGEASNTVVILEQVASDLEAALGPRHLATLIVRRFLGEARGAAGDDGHAILDLALVTADLEKISGPRHPEVLKAKTSLARLVVPRSNLFR